MKNFSVNGGFSRFIAGKGFYAALALCLIGATAAAWITAEKSIGSGTEKENVPVVPSSSQSEPQETDVYNPEKSIFAAEDVMDSQEGIHVEEPAAETDANLQDETDDVIHFVKEQKLSLPVKGNITGKYSAGELVKYDSLGEWRTHDGVDIEAPVGTEVLAAGDGSVTKVYADPLWGTCVEITHKDVLVTVYCGLEAEPPVAVGDEVKAGTVIGKIGETNLAELEKGGHLHFAVKQDGKYIDPLDKMNVS